MKEKGWLRIFENFPQTKPLLAQIKLHGIVHPKLQKDEAALQIF